MATTSACEIDEFLSVVCSDDELLREEFDAIIAAGWPDRSPDGPGRGDRAERPSRRPRQAEPAARERLLCRPRRPGTGGWSRQRSPP